ncbi:MAG: hypothetical protein ACYTFG_08885, partial [Planctomycetota bacterium]
MFEKRNLLVPLVLAAAVLSLATLGCSSSKPKPKPKPVPAYKPPPPPPLEDLSREAAEAEHVGQKAKSFSAVYGLDEAIRAYSRIVDYYPKSDEAVTAKQKVKDLSKQVS